MRGTRYNLIHIQLSLVGWATQAVSGMQGFISRSSDFLPSGPLDAAIHRVIKQFVLFFLLIGLLASSSAWSQQRSVRFEGVDAELLANVQANVRLSVLAGLGQLQQLAPAEWSRLKGAVPEEIEQALQPFGYYLPKISTAHNGTELVYQVALGEPVRLNNLDIAVSEPARALEAFKQWHASVELKAGGVLRHDQYQAAKSSLLALASRLGFFDAVLTKHEILIAEDRLSADVSLILESGMRYRFGASSTLWLSEKASLRDTVMAPYYAYQEGDPYDADLLASTRIGLQGTPYFSSVVVQPALEKLADRAVPIDVSLSAGKRHAYNVAIGAGTDTGVRASLGYENRRLNAGGHTLSFRVGASEIRETAILNYRLPLANSARDSLSFLLSREEEDNDFRTFAVTKIGAELAKQWRGATLGFGVTARRESFFLGAEEQTTDLVLPSASWNKVVSDDPYFPSFGWSADLRLSGADQSFGSDIDLIQLAAQARAVVTVGKGRILTRIRAAGTRIDDPQQLPASLGFLAGGDRSVRGYRYESIGVPVDSRNGQGVVAQTSDQQLSVGRHLLTASIEYEYPIKEQWALAAFADAGDAFNNNLDLKRGVGLGVRWRLPFGTLKVDVASALDRDGSPLRLHLTFGSDL